MSSGPELLQSIKGVRQFFADIGRLLQAAEGIMAERGWEVVGDATCLFWTSAHVGKAAHWLPRIATRQYVCPEQAPRIMAIVSVLIDDFDMGYTLTEPAVSGAYFVLPDETPSNQCWLEKWNACWVGYRSVPLDGSPYTVDMNDPYWKPVNRFKYMQVFGRPLVEITNQDALKEKIIDPLLGLIAAYSESPTEVAKGGTTP